MEEQVVGWGTRTALEMWFSSPNRHGCGLIKVRQWAILKALGKTFIQMNARDIICTSIVKHWRFEFYRALLARKMFLSF